MGISEEWRSVGNENIVVKDLQQLGLTRAQEKPRLYVPIYPQQFTENLMVSMKEQSRRVMDQFQELRPALPRGVPMALGSRRQALEKSAELLTHCRGELLIFADPQLLTQLGTALEALAASSEVTVRLISHKPFSMNGLENHILPAAATFGTEDVPSWLQLVIDRTTWLTASFPPQDVGNGPVGWWCTDPQVASVLGASLAAAFHAGDKAETGAEDESRSQVEADAETEKETETEAEIRILTQVPAETEAEETTPVPGGEEPGKMTPPAPTPAQESPQPVPEEEDEDDGFTFLIRHDDDDEAPNL